jgi:hypothetical protein
MLMSNKPRRQYARSSLRLVFRPLALDNFSATVTRSGRKSLYSSLKCRCDILVTSAMSAESEDLVPSSSYPENTNVLERVALAASNHEYANHFSEINVAFHPENCFLSHLNINVAHIRRLVPMIHRVDSLGNLAQPDLVDAASVDPDPFICPGP